MERSIIILEKNIARCSALRKVSAPVMSRCFVTRAFELDDIIYSIQRKESKDTNIPYENDWIVRSLRLQKLMPAIDLG